ncbi:MAG TPA: thrombospondin type 3 repeat-containing protein [Kofleriaceae bacterium]
MKLAPVLASLGVLLHAAPATAATFPADDAFIPLLCGGAAMFDRLVDDPVAVDSRDLVGNQSSPAGLRAADTEFLYLRVRVDLDPAPGGTLERFAWGVLIDLDGDLRDYELLFILDNTGTQPEVRIHPNRTTTIPNSPADPPDAAAMTLPFAMNGRTIAAVSRFNGDTDHFVDIAVPWSALLPLGLDRDTPIHVWAATSGTGNTLDGDLACHDRASGEPDLTVAASDPTVSDPVVDSDGDGFTDAEEVAAGSDPADPESIPVSRLEGGGGCSTGRGLDGLALLAGMIALAGRRRRPR